MFKNYIKWLLVALVMPFVSSCSWEDLPAYEGADITGVQFRYRWASSTEKDAITGEPVVKEIQLNSNSKIDAEAGTVEVNITVPAESGNFPADAREACSQSKLWGQVSLSTAARISPTDGTAALGTPYDWTKPGKFVVKAADGTKKTWTITVVSFQK